MGGKKQGRKTAEVKPNAKTPALAILLPVSTLREEEEWRKGLCVCIITPKTNQIGDVLLIFESSFLDNEIKRKQSSLENKTCAQIHQDTVTKCAIKCQRFQ